MNEKEIEPFLGRFGGLKKRDLVVREHVIEPESAGQSVLF